MFSWDKSLERTEFDFRNTNPGIHLVKSTSPGIFWKRTEAGNVFSFVCYCGRTSQRARPCGFGVESYCPPSEFHKMKHAPSLVAEVLSSEWGILWAGWSTRLRATEETTSYQGDFQGEREIEIQLNGSWKNKRTGSSFILPQAFSISCRRWDAADCSDSVFWGHTLKPLMKPALRFFCLGLGIMSRDCEPKLWDIRGELSLAYWGDTLRRPLKWPLTSMKIPCLA